MLEKTRASFKSSFAKSVIMITGGTVFAQMLNIILSPIITRIYSPEEFGVLTLFVAILTIMIFISSFSYELAIPIADDDEKAINVFSLCIIILFLTTFFITIVLFVFGDLLLHLFNADSLHSYKYLISLGFLITGLYSVFSQWAYRKKDFKTLAKTKYIQSIIGNATKLGLGVLSFGSFGLLLGQIFISGAGTTSLAKPFFNLEHNLFKTITGRNIIETAKRYSRFPIYTVPTKLLLSLSSHLPVLFISILYSPAIVGLYGLAKSITFMPMTLIGKSIEDVFYGEAASISRNNPKRIKELYNKLLKKLILLASVPTLVLVIFGPILFSFVFGESWYEAGVYSRYIAIYVFSYIIFHPSSTIFYIFEKQNIALIINIINLSLVLTVFGIATIIKLNPHTTILAYSIAKSIIELIRYLFVQRVLNEHA